MTGGGPMGPWGSNYEYEKIPKPRGIGDVPRYLGQILGGFFLRFTYILRLVWKTGPWILFLMAFFALFNGVIPVLSSIISKDILNALQTSISDGAIAEFVGSGAFYLIIFLFLIRLLKRIETTASSALERIAGELLVKQVKLQIMEKTREIDLASFDIPQFYEKLENANREASMRPLNILTRTFAIISTMIELVSYIVILAAAPGLGYAVPVIIAISVPSAVVNFVYRRKNFRYMRHRSKERRQMNYYSDVLVNKDMAKEVRLLDLSDTFIDRFMTVFGDYYRGVRKLITHESILQIVFGVLTVGTNLYFYLHIAGDVFRGNILIGDYTLYTTAIVSIAACVTTLINTSATIYEGTLFIDNLISFMKEKQTLTPVLDEPRRVSHGDMHTIEFEHVSFRYPGTERDVLKDINLKFTADDTVVLVGLNGAGKTTLIKLLTRLYDPTDGRILLDGYDIREYDVKDLYSMFGIVFQDYGRYAVSVSENIAFGDVHKRYSREDVRRAAEEANASEYIAALPDGFDTPLMRIFERNGIELSGGQWQKLAIARAFYAESDVLILDEPTAALDPIAEKTVFDQFDRLRENKMTIFVSHRLSSATDADIIVVLEDGQVIETGTHPELMARGGKYHNLFTVQAEKYIKGSESEKKPPADERGFGHPPHGRGARKKPPYESNNFTL